MSKMEKMGLDAESFDLVKFLNIVKERIKKMNKTIEFIGEVICIIAILICITITIIIKDERKTQIKILEQSLNEQIEEKQVYMNMLEEKRSE